MTEGVVRSGADRHPRFRLTGNSRRRIVACIRLAGLLALAAWALSTPGFLTPLSVISLITTVSLIGCVAVGMTFITLTGNIMSLCLGATTTASTVIFMVALNWLGIGPAIVAALAFGALLSGVQGLIIGWCRANPIIVSIASLSLITGLAQAITAGVSYYPTPGSGIELLKGRLRPANRVRAVRGHARPGASD